MPTPLVCALVLARSLLQDPAPAPAGWTQEELEEAAAEIATEVARLRGREFKAPVAVRLTDLAGFHTYARERNESFEGAEAPPGGDEIVKLLGLVAPDFDLETEASALTVSQLGGFYDPGSDTFYLLEQFSGGIARVILAHELTHALDDQHFDLDAAIRDRLGAGSDALFAIQAVIEGSGTQGGQQWALRNLAKLQEQGSGEAGNLGAAALAAAPPFLWKPMMGAYLQGQAFLDAGRSSGDAVQFAFVDPPRSSEQILHPEKYWTEERDEPLEVAFDLERAPDGWTVLGEDTLGELLLSVATTPAEERTGLDLGSAAALLAIRYTNEAASGWGGDRVVLLGRGDERRLQLVSVWDSALDAQEFGAALEEVLAESIAPERARTGASWHVGKTATAYRVEVGAGPADSADRTVAVFIASSPSASAEEQAAWCGQAAGLAWSVHPAEAR